MRAIILDENHSVSLVDKNIPSSGRDQVLLKVKAVALNRRDQWIREGKYPNVKIGVILGSDALGEVIALGDGVKQTWLGKQVIINPNINWGEDDSVQSEDYSILGMPTDGVFSEYVVIDSDRIAEAPEHLNEEEAASLPLAGLTAFRALFHHGKVTAGSKVLISGFGGGVAQFAALFGIAIGAKVWVTTSKTAGEEIAFKKGAIGAYNYNDTGFIKSAINDSDGGFDVILDSAGGEQFDQLVSALKPGGKLVVYGATNGLPGKFNLYKLFWKQCSIQGTTMGSDEDFVKMIDFVNQYKITPIIDKVFNFSSAQVAMDYMKNGGGVGKIVLNVKE